MKIFQCGKITEIHIKVSRCQNISVGSEMVQVKDLELEQDNRFILEVISSPVFKKMMFLHKELLSGKLVRYFA